MNCDACGKNMTDENGQSVIGVSLEFRVEPPNNTSFAKAQMGPYEINRAYGICWECWLRSLGVKA